MDYTELLSDYADRLSDVHAGLCGYLLKKDSPSCGMTGVTIHNPSQPTSTGTGIYAAQMMLNHPYLPVEEEGRLGEPAVRENFIQRVYVLYRWKQMVQNGLCVQSLTDFHAKHKLIIMSHGDYRPLGHLIAETQQKNLLTNAEVYLRELMRLLTNLATRKQHVNVLQHIQGYLKKELDADDKAELGETIARYHAGSIPLIVPITLLQHHFRKYPDPYIDNSYYLTPFPEELHFTALY